MIDRFILWLVDKILPHEYEKVDYRYCVSRGYTMLFDLDVFKDGQWERVMTAEPKREILKHVKRVGGYTYVTKRVRIS